MKNLFKYPILLFLVFISFNDQENCNDFSLGIELIGSDNTPFEDWYVNPKYVDENTIKQLKTKDNQITPNLTAVTYTSNTNY